MSTRPPQDNVARIVSLGYILSKDRSRTLMMFHDANPNDDSYGKFNGYFTPILPTESALEAFKRAVYDQTGLEVRQAQFRGSMHWTNFRRAGENTFAQIFLCTDFHGTETVRVPELGENRWVRLTELARGDYPIWDGDQHFLNLVFNTATTIPFHGYMPYERGVPRDFFYQRA